VSSNTFFDSRMSPGRTSSKKRIHANLYHDSKVEPWIRRTTQCACHEKEREYIKALKSMSTNIAQYLRLNELSEKNKRKIDQWKLIAFIADRCAFWVFSILTILFSVITLVIIPLLKNNGYFNIEKSIKT
jgi:hypothetical protein